MHNIQKKLMLSGLKTYKVNRFVAQQYFFTVVVLVGHTNLTYISGCMMCTEHRGKCLETLHTGKIACKFNVEFKHSIYFNNNRRLRGFSSLRCCLRDYG